MSLIDQNNKTVYVDESLYRDYLDFYQNSLLIAEKKYNKLVYTHTGVLTAGDIIQNFFGDIVNETADMLLLSNGRDSAKFEIC